MPIRNPFGKRPGVSLANDEDVRPGEGVSNPVASTTPPRFERVDTSASKVSSLLSIKTSDTGEYKLSVVNDSGIYLPPSPTTEHPERSPWSPRRLLPSRPSCDSPRSAGEIEHFSISRESFDSYRRSFDISAKSPIAKHGFPTRQSLDAERLPRPPRSALGGGGVAWREPPTEEEMFEDVRLDDPSTMQAPARRRGLFSLFGDAQHSGADAPAVSRLRPGWKRNHSGQGAELGRIQRPRAAAASSESDGEDSMDV